MSDYSQYGFDPTLINYLQEQEAGAVNDAGSSYSYDPATKTFTGYGMGGKFTRTLADMQQSAQQSSPAGQQQMMQDYLNGTGIFAGAGPGKIETNGLLDGVNAQSTNQNAASSNDPISGLYQSVLGRAPDAGGLAYWKQQLANGVPLATIQQQLQASPEAQQKTATTTNTATQTTAADPITGLYKSVLGREPDAGGKAYWQSQLNSGKSLQAIQAEMQASPEGMARKQTQAPKQTTNPYGVTTGNQFASSTNPYIQAAQQTALGNLAGAQTATAANRVNQSTPYANLQYTQTGVDAQGNPIWSANQTLAGPLAGAQSNLAQSVANQAQKGFNPNTPSVGINPGETYSDAIMRRLQPQMAQAKEQQDAQLANQGIVPGTQAYDNAMRTFQQGQNDQLTSAQVGGIGVGLTANNQSFNQQLQQANLPINQLGAFQQATQPGYVNPYSQAATGGPDYTGAYATSNAAAIAQQNANNAANASKLSGLYGLAGAGLMSSGGLPGLASAFPYIYKWLNSFSGTDNTGAANTTMSNVNMGILNPAGGATTTGVLNNTLDDYGNPLP
jgi:hypothetical protein